MRKKWATTRKVTFKPYLPEVVFILLLITMLIIASGCTMVKSSAIRDDVMLITEEYRKYREADVENGRVWTVEHDGEVSMPGYEEDIQRINRLQAMVNSSAWLNPQPLDSLYGRVKWGFIYEVRDDASLTREQKDERIAKAHFVQEKIDEMLLWGPAIAPGHQNRIEVEIRPNMYYDYGVRRSHRR